MMERNNSQLTKSQKIAVIALGMIVLFFILKEEAAAGGPISVLPPTLPQPPKDPGPISLQIVINGPQLDH